MIIIMVSEPWEGGMLKLLGLCLVVLLSACSNYCYNFGIDDNKAMADTSNFRASIEIVSGEGDVYPMNAYRLSIFNYTYEDIEVDWNKTYFICNGKIKGKFMFRGDDFTKRNAPKAPSVILPQEKLVKVIYPNALALCSPDCLNNSMIPDGETGVDLTLNVDGYEVKTQLLISKSTCKAEKK